MRWQIQSEEFQPQKGIEMAGKKIEFKHKVELFVVVDMNQHNKHRYTKKTDVETKPDDSLHQG